MGARILAALLAGLLARLPAAEAVAAESRSGERAAVVDPSGTIVDGAAEHADVTKTNGTVIESDGAIATAADGVAASPVEAPGKAAPQATGRADAPPEAAGARPATLVRRERAKGEADAPPETAGVTSATIVRREQGAAGMADAPPKVAVHRPAAIVRRERGAAVATPNSHGGGALVGTAAQLAPQRQHLAGLGLLLGLCLVLACAVSRCSRALAVEFVDDRGSCGNVESNVESVGSDDELAPWPRILCAVSLLAVVAVWALVGAPAARDGHRSPPQGVLRERAFVVAASVASSLGMTSLWILIWRWREQTPISIERLAMAAVHGALAILPAALLEVCGFRLPGGQFTLALGQAVRFAGVAIFAGVSEESLKALAASCGAIGPGCPWGTSALEVRRAFAFVGFTAGCGFMVGENALYLVRLAWDPSIEALGPRWVLLATAGARVLFNLHPWLTGAACARLATAAPAGIWPDETSTWVWAIWPSVFLHVAYDILLAANGIFGILPATAAPLVLCPYAMAWFWRSWAALGASTSKPLEFTGSVAIYD